MPTVKATTTSSATALALFQDCQACEAAESMQRVSGHIVSQGRATASFGRGSDRKRGRVTIEVMRHIVVLLAAAAVMPDLTQLKQMSARFAPVKLKHDESGLSAGDRKALPKLREAAGILNYVFMDQL